MRKRKTNKHLPPCVYQHHGAYFYVKAGKWTRLAETLSEALAVYARMHEQPNKGEMSQLIDDWLKTVKVKPSTRKQYESRAEYLKGVLGHFKPDQIRPVHVARIRDALRETPYLANRTQSVLRLVLGYGRERGITDTNAADRIKPYDEPKRGRLITADEYERIATAAVGRHELGIVMDLCRLTGQRIGDVLKISRRDLGADGIAFTQQKTGNRLVVRWTGELRDVVSRASGRGNVRGLTLLSNRDGTPLTYKAIFWHWRKACKAAGVTDVRIHDLRAMAITQANKEGKNARAIAGHTTEAQTIRYIRDKDTPIVDGPSFEFAKDLPVSQKDQ